MIIVHFKCKLNEANKLALNEMVIVLKNIYTVVYLLKIIINDSFASSYNSILHDLALWLARCSTFFFLFPHFPVFSYII